MPSNARLLMAACLVFVSSAYGECSPRDFSKSEISVYLENDLFSQSLGFGHSDRWYTNGVKFLWALQEDKIPCLSLASLGPFVKNFVEANKFEMAFGFGQLMFTPADITNPKPQPFDRPWGAWLYFSTVMQWSPREEVSELNTLAIDYGVVGPLALGEPVQKTVHGLFGYNTPEGWGNQLRNEPGIQLTYSRSTLVKPLSNSDVDVRVLYGAAAGTLFDSVNGGGAIRLAIDGDLVGAPISTIENPSLEGFSQRGRRVYLLGRIDAKAVARNTFIDGSLFRGDPYQSFTHSRDTVLQGTIGLVIELPNSPMRRFAFLVNRRGREFNTPSGASPLFTFGTVVVEFSLD